MSNPLFTIYLKCQNGVICNVVVNSIVNGVSSGGVRIVEGLKIDEVRMLAEEMTLKYAFCGMPRGGAKCGIHMPAHLTREQRFVALEDVGRRLRAIIRAGIYYPGMDMNCGSEELGAIYRGAGLDLGAMTDTSFYTAVFAAEAVRAVADISFAERKGPLNLAVEGLGKVASHLTGMLEPDRFRIVAVSTVLGAVYNPLGYSPEELRESRFAHGDALVDHLQGERLESRDVLLFQPVDILVPCARVGSIHKGNADRVLAKCIVSVANAPCTAEARSILHRRRIPVLPGFVGNVGGVLGSSLFDRGVPQATVQMIAAEPYRLAVTELMRRSLEHGEQPTELARRMAQELISARRGQPASKGARLLAVLVRRLSVAKRYVNRHAARNCARHFAYVAESIGRLPTDVRSEKVVHES